MVVRENPAHSETADRLEQQQKQQQPNRYAHLVAGKASAHTTATVSGANVTTRASTQVAAGGPPNGTPSRGNLNGSNKPHLASVVPGPGSNSAASGRPNQHQQRQAYTNYNYYASFSSVDWREQWIIMKDKLLEHAEEPQNQRKLILFIVCCALLLDNMLYMVIVPIIPDYLRSIGAWSTYAENAKWIRRNTTGSGTLKWERIGGNVVYEGEDSAVGFLFASKAIVQLFINPFSGAIIDRIGYEIPMMIGLIVMFFSTMVFACGQTYSVLFLARSLQGVGSAFADTSGLAMIADRFTEENERQRALGVALAFISFGCLVAPPFGSVLYQGAGKEVPFIILSLVCLLDGSLLLLVTPPGTFSSLWPSSNPSAQVGRSAQATMNKPPAVNKRTTQASSAEPDTHVQEAMSPCSLEAQDYGTGSNYTNEDNSKSSETNKLQRQKSISRRQSMKVASAGEAPKGTPIYVLFRDPCIACCSGALVVANISLAFLEPTISIWVKNTMSGVEEWQMGMIWLPAFVPHVLGVYSTVKLADKYPRYQWLIAAIGLILEGLSCLMVPFCSSFWSLIVPISIICFGLALIDTAILPTLGYLVDTRYVSVYGSIYAIADISYSLSYAIGPIIAGGIVEAIGFTALNILIAIVTLGYTPVLMMLRNIHDYEPFSEGGSAPNGLCVKSKDELAPFGRFGRRPIDEDEEEEDDDDDDGKGAGQAGHEIAIGEPEPAGSGPLPDQMGGAASDADAAKVWKYESPKWASSASTAQAGELDQSLDESSESVALDRFQGRQQVYQQTHHQPEQRTNGGSRKPALRRAGSSAHSSVGDTEPGGGGIRRQHTVKIVESPPASSGGAGASSAGKNPFLAR